MATDVVTADGEVLEAAPAFPDVRLDRRFVINRDGKEFALYAGLLDLLHQVSEGFFAIETRLEQVPTQDNGNVAICSARVQVFDREQPDVVRRLSTGLGDASPANVTRMMAPHLIRMAETRAKARALRDAVNVGLAALEELGPGGGEDAEPERQAETFAPYRAPGGAAPRPVETIQLEGRTFTRAQVVDIYTARLGEASRAGLQLAPMGAPGGPPTATAPLPEIVTFSSELKRRLEARAGRSTGK